MRDHGIEPGPGTILVPPVGHRTAIALQLHAAAVITDSGGVQREAAWLHTPCIVVRERTEWVETTDAPGATSRLVGLDTGLAMSALAELGALPTDEEHVRRRVHDLTLEPSGASEIISAALQGLPAPSAARP